MDTNLTSCFLTSKYAIPHLRGVEQAAIAFDVLTLHGVASLGLEGRASMAACCAIWNGCPPNIAEKIQMEKYSFYCLPHFMA
ncbi:MAG: hypothetical protein K9N49_02195 [Candidatus Marinimicrobia bacterium]|nr:hypothetical protein [Candidatus Neomarinimicrobiota bacterium]